MKKSHNDTSFQKKFNSTNLIWNNHDLLIFFSFLQIQEQIAKNSKETFKYIFGWEIQPKISKILFIILLANRA